MLAVPDAHNFFVFEVKTDRKSQFYLFSVYILIQMTKSSD